MTVICPHSCVVCSPKIKLRGKRVSFFFERTKSELHRQCIYISNTLYTHVGPLILLRSLCLLHVSLPFLVSFAFAQPLSLTLSLRCSAVCFSFMVSVFVCVCVRLYLEVRHLVAIRVNHPSFLQLLVTHKLTQMRTMTRRHTQGRT